MFADALNYIADASADTYAMSARSMPGHIEAEAAPGYGDRFIFQSANEIAKVFYVISDSGEYEFLRQSENANVENVIGEVDQFSVVNPRDMVHKIRAVLGLNNVQIAEILRISRPSLYNHISDKEAPKSLIGYQKLYEVALFIESNPGMNVKSGLKSILVEGNTLLGHLKASIEDGEKIRWVCGQVADKLRLASRSVSLSAEEQRRISRDLTKFS